MSAFNISICSSGMKKSVAANIDDYGFIDDTIAIRLFRCLYSQFRQCLICDLNTKVDAKIFIYSFIILEPDLEQLNFQPSWFSRIIINFFFFNLKKTLQF